LEWGEATLEGAKRELAEETKFSGQTSLRWHPEPYATADAIVHHESNDSSHIYDTYNVTSHYVVAVCFAELNVHTNDSHPPSVVSCDDAADAKWYSLEEIASMDSELTTPGLAQKVEHAESLYEKGFLL
jgi:ADP-ribose pyrophosphatase YjhB (NUDIX family)